MVVVSKADGLSALNTWLGFSLQSLFFGNRSLHVLRLLPKLIMVYRSSPIYISCCHVHLIVRKSALSYTFLSPYSQFTRQRKPRSKSTLILLVALSLMFFLSVLFWTSNLINAIYKILDLFDGRTSGFEIFIKNMRLMMNAVILVNVR